MGRFGMLLASIVAVCGIGAGPAEVSRGEGQAGLDRVIAQYQDAIAQHAMGIDGADWGDISAQIDAMAGQKDAWASKLFWYTDLDAAKKEAARTNKPILSLRLLGNLDSDLSCANSRFFRTTLYPEADVSKVMHDAFVLYWSSERPAPVITVDFGDGRKLQRTITGNSVHYVMLGDGTVIDALPGLYATKPFLAWLNESAGLAKRLDGLDATARAEALSKYHTEKLGQIQNQWMRETRGRLGALAANAAIANDAKAGPPNAARAAPVAEAKRSVQRALVKELLPGQPVAIDDVSEANWTQLAAAHGQEVDFDPMVRAVIRLKRNEKADNVELLAKLRQAIALDTVKNEFVRHQAIHSWFVQNEGAEEWAALNERVYTELFLTPRSDPWLGLAPAEVYSGLDGEGKSAP